MGLYLVTFCLIIVVFCVSFAPEITCIGPVASLEEEGSTPKGDGAPSGPGTESVEASKTGSHPLTCTDWEGNLVAEGETFLPRREEPCWNCVCNDGYPVMCKDVSCHPPACEMYEEIKGKCCQYTCITMPDHPHDSNINITITNNMPPSIDANSFGLRIVASTVTSFLILALLLFMIHRIRQRRLLIMMRRLHAEREEDSVAYMSQLENMDIGIDFPPYEDPPPPYTPSKPEDIPTGEAPPPYEESQNNNNDSQRPSSYLSVGESGQLIQGQAANGVMNRSVSSRHSEVIRELESCSTLENRRQSLNTQCNSDRSRQSPQPQVSASPLASFAGESAQVVVRMCNSNPRTSLFKGGSVQNDAEDQLQNARRNLKAVGDLGERSHFGQDDLGDRSRTCQRPRAQDAKCGHLLLKKSDSMEIRLGMGCSPRNSYHECNEHLNDRDKRSGRSQRGNSCCESCLKRNCSDCTPTKQYSNTPNLSEYVSQALNAAYSPNVNHINGDIELDQLDNTTRNMDPMSASHTSTSSQHALPIINPYRVSESNSHIYENGDRYSNNIHNDDHGAIIQDNDPSPRECNGGFSMYDLSPDTSGTSTPSTLSPLIQSPVRPCVRSGSMTSHISVCSETGERRRSRMNSANSATTPEMEASRDMLNDSVAGSITLRNDVQYPNQPFSSLHSAPLSPIPSTSNQHRASENHDQMYFNGHDQVYINGHVVNGFRDSDDNSSLNLSNEELSSAAEGACAQQNSPDSIDQSQAESRFVDQSQKPIQNSNNPPLRRVIYRDPDDIFSVIDSVKDTPSKNTNSKRDSQVKKSDSAKSSNRSAGSKPKKNSSDKLKNSNEQSKSGNEQSEASQWGSNNRQQIRRRESPETFRRLSQAWDKAAKYKEYGFVDKPEHNGNGDVITRSDILARSRSNSRERRRRSRSRERRSQSRERRHSYSRDNKGASHAREKVTKEPSSSKDRKSSKDGSASVPMRSVSNGDESSQRRCKKRRSRLSENFDGINHNAASKTHSKDRGCSHKARSPGRRNKKRRSTGDKALNDLSLFNSVNQSVQVDNIEIENAIIDKHGRINGLPDKKDVVLDR